ncbi:MAG: hypothetical protein JSW71_11645, partial [Gemmatimonadota bacterium]
TLAKTPADRFATMSQLAEALSGEPPARAAFAAASSGPADRGGATVTAYVLSKLIGYSRLSMKNDISYLSFKRSDEIVEAINSIARGIPRDSDEVFFVNQGGGTITVICEAEKERLLDSVRNQAVYYRPRVGVLSIQEAHEEDVPASIEVPGLYAYFINRLAEGGINILDLISTRTQLTVIVAEDDLTSAFSLLSDRIREHRRRGQDLA